MTPISVVIITYNEEDNIARCIASVKDIADDVVVVDSFSTDNTCRIASEMGARVFFHKFEGHIEQKNFAITRALYPCILSLDADEVLSDDLAESIKSVKDNWQSDGYEMNRLTNYCGKWIRHCGWYPDRKLRLWDSRKGMWGGMNPHDQFIMKPGSVISRLKGDILHYSYNSVDDHLQQIIRFSSIAARSYHDAGKKLATWRMIISPVAAFVRQYLFNLGFLDGKFGFIICKNSAREKWMKYRKLKKLYAQSKG